MAEAPTAKLWSRRLVGKTIARIQDELTIQAAALRHELDNIHTYDFVEGTIPAPLAPELVPFFPTDGAYYDYFSFDSAESVKKALDDLSHFLETEGPYEGLIAFSLGGALAATFLIREATLNPATPLPFKCAIFLSGGAPLDPVALERGEVVLLDAPLPGEDSQLLHGFPTAHIWGRNDELWGDRSETLCALCDPQERAVLLHDEAHAVPGARAKEALLGSVRAIRRTVGRAVMAG
ncbi:hypothetical protein ASPWEDRAFT_186869 [Aspergillus wentii DTO 134E9]|uniref:Serine hydrolase domain-containing protein n=1 Tax=Aspergillus wentii DTO 134E9 TaxID=1073089 RepID=A0A1L9R7L2_ASPWE|nr:uncharacterized protein ASPWEDRAFT_186869 [Aspergillus wentii DTO 134E9]KAI9927531.1 hypothetical protein MW887_003149 [Aspergillus wentii]OJJ30909.1 hypothetical protein ASPWEDRAFT_186869 [Aspergillus wentii DTO 134E9]